MANDSIPANLRDALADKAGAAISDLLQRAFAAGYAKGSSDTAANIMVAARGLVKPSLIGGAHAPGRASDLIGIELPSDAHPNAAEARRFPYGAVANAFRTALRRGGPTFGYNLSDLVGLVSEILGEDVSDMNHRDTIKRLRRSGELQSRNGVYYAGPKLRAHNENGEAEASPIAEGAPTPSDHDEEAARSVL